MFGTWGRNRKILTNFSLERQYQIPWKASKYFRKMQHTNRQTPHHHMLTRCILHKEKPVSFLKSVSLGETIWHLKGYQPDMKVCETLYACLVSKWIGRFWWKTKRKMRCKILGRNHFEIYNLNLVGLEAARTTLAFVQLVKSFVTIDLAKTDTNGHNTYEGVSKSFRNGHL